MAIVHFNSDGDRFTDGTYGVFYAGRTIETAIAETRYHRVRFLQATSEPAQEIDMRVYAVDLDANLHDIRAKRESHGAYYHPRNYAASQELALKLREKGSNGIVYASVRDDGDVPSCFVCGFYLIVGRNDTSAMYGMEGAFP